MELNFVSNGGAFISEFDATSDFKLHIEGLLLSDFRIYQRTAGNNYELVAGLPVAPDYGKTLDYDFTAMVYPKSIKIVSEVEPTVATVTFNA